MSIYSEELSDIFRDILFFDPTEGNMKSVRTAPLWLLRPACCQLTILSKFAKATVHLRVVNSN